MAGAPSVNSICGQRVVVGVGDMAVSNLSQVTVSTYALGSCVGVVAYDPDARAGGILHLMLPNSTISPEKAATQPAMFADTGLPLFFRALTGMRCERHRLRLFLAGGACVLQGHDAFKIGDRNAEAVKKYLQTNGYAVYKVDLGGVHNRTIHLEVGTGSMTMKTPTGTGQLSLS